MIRKHPSWIGSGYIAAIATPSATAYPSAVPRGTLRGIEVGLIRERSLTPMSKLEKAKSRLGRGLSSLISISDLPVEAEVPAVSSVGAASAADAPSGPATGAASMAA